MVGQLAYYIYVPKMEITEMFDEAVHFSAVQADPTQCSCSILNVCHQWPLSEYNNKIYDTYVWKRAYKNVNVMQMNQLQSAQMFKLPVRCYSL